MKGLWSRRQALAKGAMESKAPEGSQADLKLVAHPRAKSKVWKYFGFDADADGCILQWKKISCRICMAQIAYSGNTSNLSYHLEKNHPEEFCELVKSNTEQMRGAFATAFSKLKPDSSSQQPLPQDGPTASLARYSHDSPKQQELTAAVARLISEGLYPASIVDEPSFQLLLHTADPRYQLPSRKYFTTQALPERYSAIREVILEEVARVSWCGICADMWHSPSQSRTYVTLAVHFLPVSTPPSSLSVRSWCLKTFEIPPEDAAEAMTRSLYEAFIEWGLSNKLSGAATDRGQDITQACALLDIPVHVPCLGHAFHVAIQAALQLPRLSALLERCRKLLDYFEKVPAAVGMLVAKQKQLGMAAQHLLVSDRVGGWGRTLAMLQRLLEQQLAITGVLGEDSCYHHLMLEPAEWATLEGLAELLRPFQQVGATLAASQVPAISMLKPLLHMLQSSTLRVQETDLKELGMAKEVIAQELACAYQEVPEVDQFLNVASFLDPRYKHLPFLSAPERQGVELRVAQELRALLDSAHNVDLRPPQGEEEEEPPGKKKPPTPPPPPPPSLMVHSMLAEIFHPAGGEDEEQEWEAHVLEELSNFKAQKPLALSGDPLRWWSERLLLFPVLHRVVQKYWCVPATRMPPARLFGPAAQHTVSTKRNWLTPMHVDRQVFLYENARSAQAGVEEDQEDEEAEGRVGQEHVWQPADMVDSDFGGGTAGQW
ncbi:E3 SUMO-protein ligase ZBED1-like [Ochotona curzoniae]|uniref:E3 SUMO-protein ligase ZBED1-like n=1 Tax=Ochotona curzoniae TaxID=130825 RepID=UPI001B34A2D4|nr:E3 SUMO-protein ligase ZBED1-like [Ochotona curzoniae]XP_040854487.1 E3 SUMO-protein ligase ZBED1-like [Ochotona curzoniae]XP_040854518.1 E3 SUMO-protein ligase ZBED1-like [Ochotona curzoniae]XP_040854527.1 E3 SUMO-protein ligase ZBED1-like [Ochotona curzoniae]